MKIFCETCDDYKEFYTDPKNKPVDFNDDYDWFYRAVDKCKICNSILRNKTIIINWQFPEKK